MATLCCFFKNLVLLFLREIWHLSVLLEKLKKFIKIVECDIKLNFFVWEIIEILKKYLKKMSYYFLKWKTTLKRHFTNIFIREKMLKHFFKVCDINI